MHRLVSMWVFSGEPAANVGIWGRADSMVRRLLVLRTASPVDHEQSTPLPSGHRLDKSL
jgi:hypothetical protein